MPIKLLYEEINELLELGMFTLTGKLKGVPDEKLVSRLVELWSFYFGTVIPYLKEFFYHCKYIILHNKII
jgi:hypothetical protein